MKDIRASVYRDIHMAGRVKRYHTWPVLHQQTVAEHCWGVASLYAAIFGMPRAEVFYYCLHHDSGELWAGDLPFTVKDKVPGLREAMEDGERAGRAILNVLLPQLTDQEKRRVKICDLLEMYFFGLIEVAMGNTYGSPIAADTWAAAIKTAGDYDEDIRAIAAYRYRRLGSD